MSTCLQWTRHVQTRHEADVLVAGGGPAGVAAATAAARRGAKVFLAEWTGCLGGLGTSGLMSAFCPMTDGEKLLVGGIGKEVVERLRARKGMSPDDRPDRWDWLPYDPEALKLVYDDMMEEAGVTLRFCTALVDVVKEGEEIQAAILCGREGPYAVKAHVFIDTTGDAALSLVAGAPTELGDEQGRTMPPSLCATFSGVDWEAYKQFRPEVKEAYEKAIEDGVFSAPDLHLVGASRISRQLAGMNINHVFGINGAEDEQLTKGLIQGRRQLQEFLRFYREYVRGFEKMEMAASASLLGVRETRRVVGEYVLGIEDFKARRSFPDEIGRYSYPIDVHPLTRSREDYEKMMREFTQELRLGKGESYGIPYRSLIAKGVSNLLVAGRCFSTDHMMQGSTRVMPCCFITGQAAGTAAAMCAAKRPRPRDIDRNALRHTLRQAGAYVP